MSCFKFRRRLLSIRLLVFIPLIYFVYFVIISLTTNLLTVPAQNDGNDGFNHKVENKENIIVMMDDDDEDFKNYNLIKSNGALGKAYHVNEKALNETEKQLFDEGWKLNAFNRYASDHIPINRTLPDVRISGCNSETYPDLRLTTSVIICFHNEAWSVLLRSVYSLLNRSPAHLLKEIILADDFSDMEHLLEKLDTYLKVHFPDERVRVIRNKKREGLIRTRLFGAREAKGDVLIFLDSHIEATPGWLEPLVNEIQKNETVVVTPIIDVLDQHTLEYRYNKNTRVSVGGFDWNLQFTWHGLPERLYALRKSDHDPVPSPTMAGGLFGISKDYFVKLGTYDAQMDIWGGENLEISFRIWMCGGTLVTVPCSHVGHIFRDRSPYKWMPGVNVLRKNSVRLADVWLDEYKKIYYDRINQELGEYGDTSERKALRSRLNCKSFQWYIDNIYPELWIPFNSIYSGAIENQITKRCVDASAGHRDSNKPVISFPCHNQGGNQHWYYSKNSEIRRDDMCIDYSGGRSKVNQPDSIIVFACHGEKGNQEWVYDYENTKQMRHPPSDLCMEIKDRKLVMNYCDENNPNQKWLWKLNSNKINKF